MSKSLRQIIKDFFIEISSNKKMLNEKNDISHKKEVFKNIQQNDEKNIFEEAAERNHYKELQNKFIRGEIKEENMTFQEIIGVEKLFVEQITEMKRKNENLEKKIYKKLINDQEFIALYKKYKSGSIKKEDLTQNQIIQLEFFLRKESLK